MKVEATIKPHVKEKIIKCLREGPRPLKAHRIFANPPKIVKVITYGTSEHITLMEALDTPESTCPLDFSLDSGKRNIFYE
ncbi:hypothetical protein ANCCAN_18076 [Ancylostoma caninum]|uniref:Uncharacterized protein n=1 Tax=Ancylostoma caninum TaxID=29170 RepID=A0A368G0D5_ANCCA|nr:hypothetical protein ANCCAN_18076 [Ancylostoma caninum]